MRDDEEPGGAGDDGGKRRANPYPLPGQGWSDGSGEPESSGFIKPPDFKKVPPLPGNPSGEGVPVSGARVLLDGGRSRRHRRRRRSLLVPFLVGGVFVLAWGGGHVAGVFSDSGQAADHLRRDVPTASPPLPAPEPVSTVPPRVRGWKAVSSSKYGLSYDVPRAWRVKSPTLIVGFEDANGKPRAAMSGTALYRERFCENSYRAAAGFNQYVETDTGAVAAHAARKWADGAYTPDGGGPPSVSLSAPETVRVGRVKGVRMRAEVTVRAPGRCGSPHAVVHTVAVPGTARGRTTVFVAFADGGVPDAAPERDLQKIIASLRAS